ncbi:MAG: phosphoglycerate mutase [Proteobacteria bacterium]|nr:phosphoglycerate mutase [Pseudomonadota bacterium]
MNLHLFVPNLFWPEATFLEIYRDLSLPAIETLLAKSSQFENESQGVEEWLCRTFSVEKQQDWPVASITLLADKTGNMKVGNGYWLRADPVHLQVEHNQVVLADSRIFRISPEEARQFVDVINKHFAENDLHPSSYGSGAERRGMVFLPLCSDRWYLCVAKTPVIHTHVLSEVIIKNINDFLPFGAENMLWRGIFNEIQMLLHEHPLNQAREERGEPAVNSVWFWGGGVMPKLISSPYIHVWSNDVFPRALALACGTDYAELPASVGTWQQSIASGRHLVFLNSLHGKSQYGDAHGWRESLKEMEENWFSPLLAALKKGKIDQIVVTTTNKGRARSFSVTKSNLWKFWCVRKSLSTYVD